MSFENPFGEPVDPKYVRFRVFIENFVLGKPEVEEVRWNHREGDWFRYPRPRFTYIDFGARPGPESPLERKLVGGQNFQWVYESRTLAFGMPQLFRDVAARHARLEREGHPFAVWNIYDGSWREIQRDGRHDTPPDDEPWH